MAQPGAGGPPGMGAMQKPPMPSMPGAMGGPPMKSGGPAAMRPKSSGYCGL
jgi:hypothetical protein